MRNGGEMENATNGECAAPGPEFLILRRMSDRSMEPSDRDFGLRTREVRSRTGFVPSAKHVGNLKVLHPKGAEVMAEEVVPLADAMWSPVACWNVDQIDGLFAPAPDRIDSDCFDRELDLIQEFEFDSFPRN